MNRASFFEYWSPRLLSILRVVVALLYFEHGTAKLLHFPYVKMFDEFQLYSLVGLAGVIEIIGSPLLLLGLFTRPVAFILCGEMAVAYIMVHAPRGNFPIVNGGELAAFYCFVFLYFAAAGGGPWSLDRLRERRRPRWPRFG